MEALRSLLLDSSLVLRPRGLLVVAWSTVASVPIEKILETACYRYRLARRLRLPWEEIRVYLASRSCFSPRPS